MVKRAAALAVVGVFVAGAAAAVFVGPARTVPRLVAAPSVGAVQLDSGTTLATLSAVEDLRIDGNAEDFPAISGVIRVAPNGNIVVPMGQDYQYRFYAPDGRRITTFGRQGSGPGEFRTFETRMGWTGDTLWVWDNSLGRITYASSDGKYIDEESFRGMFSAPRDWGRFPVVMVANAVEGIRDGELLASGREWELPLPDTWTAMRRPIVAVGPLRVVRRVVGNFPYFGEDDFVAAQIGDGRPYEMALPLRAQPWFDAASDASRFAYLTTHVTEEYGGHLALTVLAPSGDTLVSRKYAFVGEKIPERVRDSVIEAYLARQGRGGRGRSAIDPERFARARAEAPRRALKVYAPVSALVAGRDSTTWIGFRRTAGTRTWLVVDARGEPVGSLSLPADVRVSEAERGWVWGAQPDSNDVVSIVRYRVTGW